MATARVADSKKKSVNKFDGPTGMSLATQRHFIDVKQKINNYVDEQLAYEYDGKVLESQIYPHRHSPLVNSALLDGNKKTTSLGRSKSPRPQTPPSTSGTTRKHTSSHHGTSSLPHGSSSSRHGSNSSHHSTSSPHVTHREVKTSSTTGLK
jgi:hypothetical protein